MRTLILLSLLFSTLSSISQPEKEAILKPINDLFAGMKAGDSAKVHQAFNTTATLNGIDTKQPGKPIVKQATLANFLNAIGTAHKEVWNEAIWDVTVQQDDHFAQVWAHYAFYRDNTFSHCGVDAFQLLHEAGGWKIVTLIDTRRKDNCNIPKEIADKFK